MNAKEETVSAFEDMLTKEWNLWYSSRGKGAPRNKFEENERKHLDGGLCAIFNSQLVSNKREPNFEIEEQSEIKVYKNFDESRFNFNNCEQSEILFYVNLDEERVLSKEQNEAQEDLNLLEEDNNCDKSVSSFINHPIIANISPIAKKHSILPIYREENLPQVIGQDILSLVLSIFKLSSSSYLRLGFNSLGGFASVNHLHFQLYYADEFFPYTQVFPIENATRKHVLDSSLQNPKEEINMYSVGVRIEQLADYFVKGLVFSPINAEQQETSDIFSSLAFAVGTYTNILLDEQIPHNIFISEYGQRIYVIPRQFDQEVKKIHGLCKPGILEIAGVFVCQDKEFFQGISTNQLQGFMEQHVSLQSKQFENSLSKFTQLLIKNYS